MDLKGIEDRLQGLKLKTRFAPTPNGHLHLGHIAHCIYLWGVAQSLNGHVLLRVEDHDRQRVKTSYIESILRDLDWLGFTPDGGYQFGGGNTFLQSFAAEHYESAIKGLEDKGLIYHCICSRKQIKERMENDQTCRAYDGFCRSRKHHKGKEAGLRLKVVNKEKVSFWDLVLGCVYQDPAHDFGDLLLVDRRKNFSYHLCVVEDDLRHNINVVIRGLDLLPATGVQTYLRQLLQANTSKLSYFHHPLLCHKDKPQVKLSKRNWDESIASLRERGYSAAQLIGQVACDLGLQRSNNKLLAGDVKGLWGG